MLIFSPADQAIRKNLWRTLFVLDRFLSASLGRPTAIHEDDCSGDTLARDLKLPGPELERDVDPGIETTNSRGLQASVRTCHIVGVILQEVYSKRKVSTKIAQQIAEQCKGWGQTLDPMLRSRPSSSTMTPSQGIAVLHTNLFYYHSVILLTRPFFVFLLSKEKKDSPQRHRKSSRMQNFADACVRTSSRTVTLVQNAYEGRYLPRRNPFIL